MNYLKLKIGLIAILFSVLGISQEAFDATVVGIINVGEQDYSVLNKKGTSDYYKTNLYRKNELSYNQNVTLEPNNENYKVVANTLTTNVYATLINTTNSTVSLSDIKSPKLENGILFFEDDRHYDKTYELLESYIDGGSIDEMLDKLEHSIIGYNSYRTWFNNTYNWLDGEFTSSEIKYLSNLEFVNDEITKTLLNEDRFIGKGDTIYQYQAQNIVLKFSKYNNDAKDFLTSLKFDADITDIPPSKIDALDIIVVSQLLEYPFHGGLKAEIIAVEDSLRYVSSVFTNNVNCSVTQKKLRITVEEGVYADTTYNYDSTSYTIDWIDSPFDIGSASATLVIEWGDGITQTINNYSGQWLSHNYPSSSVGTYVYPTTTLTFDDSNGDVQQLEDGNSVNGGASISFYVNYACANAEIAQWSSQESGIWKMTTKIWITDNFFGNHIGSYTHAWKKKNNGNWERHKADIWCEVNGVFRNNDCIQQSTKTGSKYRHLFKKVQKTKTKLFKHYDISNGDINSRHYMIKGNLTLQLGMVINPC